MSKTQKRHKEYDRETARMVAGMLFFGGAWFLAVALIAVLVVVAKLA